MNDAATLQQSATAVQPAPKWSLVSKLADGEFVPVDDFAARDVRPETVEGFLTALNDVYAWRHDSSGCGQETATTEHTFPAIRRSL